MTTTLLSVRDTDRTAARTALNSINTDGPTSAPTIPADYVPGGGETPTAGILAYIAALRASHLTKETLAFSLAKLGRKVRDVYAEVADRSAANTLLTEIAGVSTTATAYAAYTPEVGETLGVEVTGYIAARRAAILAARTLTVASKTAAIAAQAFVAAGKIPDANTTLAAVDAANVATAPTTPAAYVAQVGETLGSLVQTYLAAAVTAQATAATEAFTQAEKARRALWIYSIAEAVTSTPLAVLDVEGLGSKPATCESLPVLEGFKVTCAYGLQVKSLTFI